MGSIIILAGVFGLSIWVYQTYFQPLIGKEKRQKYFAHFLKEIGKIHVEKVQNVKAELFKNLSSLEPHSPELRKENKGIRILEIGIGSGANFKFYPDTCIAVVLDANPHTEIHFTENLKQVGLDLDLYPGIKLERFVLGKADEMKDLESGSFDAVISTFVFCNVDSIANTFGEISRLLVPGGKFFYMDHIQAKSGTWLGWTQRVLDFFKIWPFFFDGCQVSRQPNLEIGKIGFSSVEQKLFDIDTSGALAWKIIESHVSGVATK